MVNAPYLAKERGIRVSETISSDVEDYSSLITVELTTDKSKRQVAGTLFGRKEPRIVRVDDYRLEAVPSGYMWCSRTRIRRGSSARSARSWAAIRSTLLVCNWVESPAWHGGGSGQCRLRDSSRDHAGNSSAAKHLLCDASGIGIMVSMGMVP